MSAKIKRLVLHIGSHKAGSTAIQDFCCDNNSILQAANIYYPIGMFEKFPRQHSYICRMLGAREFDELSAAFARTADAARERGSDTVFMSGEDLCSCNETFVIKLAAICNKFFERIEYIFILRSRDEYHISNLKHNLAHGQPLTEVRYLEKFKFSPRNVQNIWRAHFSHNSRLILYDDIKRDFLRFFFKIVFGLNVQLNKHSNVSNDLLIALIINAFLKDKMSNEVERIIWAVSEKWQKKVEYPIEEFLLNDIRSAAPDGDWFMPDLDRPNSLLRKRDKDLQYQDPALVCEMMIFFFTELQKHFQKSATDRLTSEQLQRALFGTPQPQVDAGKGSA